MISHLMIREKPDKQRGVRQLTLVSEFFRWYQQQSFLETIHKNPVPETVKKTAFFKILKSKDLSDQILRLLQRPVNLVVDTARVRDTPKHNMCDM